MPWSWNGTGSIGDGRLRIFRACCTQRIVDKGRGAAADRLSFDPCNGHLDLKAIRRAVSVNTVALEVSVR